MLFRLLLPPSVVKTLALSVFVFSSNVDLAKGQWGLDDIQGQQLNLPSRCEHYPNLDAILCRDVVTWPVQMYGLNPEEEGFETMEAKIAKEQSYKDSLLPLLDREECKTDFLLFICSMLYQPCFEIDTVSGDSGTLYNEETGPFEVRFFPNTTGVRLPTDTTKIYPRGNCAKSCMDLYSGECAEKLGQALQFQLILGGTVVPVPIIEDDNSCIQDVYGGITPLAADSSKGWYVNAFVFPEEFNGQPIFPDEGNFVAGFGTIPCFDVREFVASKGGTFCPEKQLATCDRRGTRRNPYVLDYMECINWGLDCEDEELPKNCQSVCPEDFIRESGENACNLHCIAECPELMFTGEEISFMWLCMIVPALLGLPLNIFASASYFLGRKNVHKKTPVMLKISASLAVIWTMISIIPSATLFTDTICTYDVTIQQGGSDVCAFLRGTLCVLQSMLFWVLASIVDLHLAVVNGKTQGARNDLKKFYHLLCWGLPLIMYILTYALEVTDPDLLFRASDFDGQYPALNWNRYKDIFSCTPKLQTIPLELFVVWSPFIIAALSIFFILCSVLYRIGSIYRKQNSTKKSKQGGRSEVGGGCVASAKAFKKAMDKYGATKLTMLGLSAFGLVCLLLATILDTFPKMDDFSDYYEIEYSCSITELSDFAGQPCLDDVPTTCCYNLYSPTVQGVAPDPVILGVGYFMSLSLIPLIFGILFGIDSKHVSVWRRVFGSKTTVANSKTMLSSTSSTK